MSAITEQLIEAANGAPLWKGIIQAGADEIKRLQEDNNKIRGRMHDQWINQNKMKADAVRGILNNDYDCETPTGDSAYSQATIEDHANKLERGEL